MEYQRLNENKNEIRVFRFVPRTERLNKADIELRLETVSLDDIHEYYPGVTDRLPDPGSSITEVMTWRSKPFQPRFRWGDFEALSYRWGNRKPRSPIYVNEKRMKVPKNLKGALRALHGLPETDFGMSYWSDYLCINQKDQTEKNLQIKLMARIYSEARSVVAWLGPEAPEDQYAAEFMRNSHLREPPSQTVQQGFHNFLRRPYWKRVWIIQELALNHHDTIFLLGRHKFTRGMVREGASRCQTLQKERRTFTRDTSSDIWVISSHVYRLVTLKPSDKTVLRKALNLARRGDATYERDKVYGILGLLPDSISLRITPDYNTKPEQVFISMTIAIILGTKNLEQIVYVTSKVPCKWPSWVPDPRQPFLRHHIRHLRNRRASGNKRAIVRFLDEPGSKNLLFCKGFKVDVIDGIAAPLSQDSRPVDPTSTSNQYTEHPARVLLRTLVMNHPRKKQLLDFAWPVGESKVAPNSVSPLLDQPRSQPCNDATDDCQDLCKYREVNKNFLVFGLPFPSLFPSFERYTKKGKHILYGPRLILVSLKGRKFATTNTGYACLVPDSVKKGDLVAVLLGCNMPVLLRPHQGRFRMLGECYVHGLMDGEVFGLEENGAVVCEELCLC